MVADALSQKSDVGELMTISLPKFSFLADMKESDSHEEIQSIRSRLSKDPETVPGYTICGGWLCYKGRIMLPINSSLKATILKEFHNTPSAGHEGYFRTYKRVMHNFYWKGVKRDVRPYVEECEVCQRSKYETYHLPLPIPDRIWEDILLDFIDGLPKSGGKEYYYGCGRSALQVWTLCGLGTPIHGTVGGRGICGAHIQATWHAGIHGM